MNIYESKHIWLGIPTNNNWDNYVKKNTFLRVLQTATDKKN